MFCINLLYITLQHVPAFLKKPSSGNVKYLKKSNHMQHNKMFRFLMKKCCSITYNKLIQNTIVIVFTPPLSKRKYLALKGTNYDSPVIQPVA
jgi:hypothetical protein